MRRYKDGEHVARVGANVVPFAPLPAFGPNGPFLGDMWADISPTSSALWICVPDPTQTVTGRRWAPLGFQGFPFSCAVAIGAQIACRLVGDFQIAPANTPGVPIVGVTATAGNPGDVVNVGLTGTMTAWQVGAAPVVAGDYLTTDANGLCLSLIHISEPTRPY